MPGSRWNRRPTMSRRITRGWLLTRSLSSSARRRTRRPPSWGCSAPSHDVTRAQDRRPSPSRRSSQSAALLRAGLGPQSGELPDGGCGKSALGRSAASRSSRGRTEKLRQHRSDLVRRERGLGSSGSLARRRLPRRWLYELRPCGPAAGPGCGILRILALRQAGETGCLPSQLRDGSAELSHSNGHRLPTGRRPVLLALPSSHKERCETTEKCAQRCGDDFCHERESLRIASQAPATRDELDRRI